MSNLHRLKDLKPNPINTSIYEVFDPASSVFQEMARSMQENGLLQPIVIRPDGTILSGHRRRTVGLSIWGDDVVVPCEIQTEGDDRVLLIEYNRYRLKTGSETMREAELLAIVMREKARDQQGTALAADTTPIDTRKEVAAAVGMKPRTFDKLATVFALAKENENAKAKLAKVDSGEITINAAYNSLRTLMVDAADKEDADIPDFAKFFNSWQFSENDPRFGIPHPGRIPGQIAGNIIYYFSEPGDLVVDPMGGGGSTLDVAEFLGRECLSYDVAPRRPDIQQWDISKGFPVEAKDCQLIFMDPPYWNMMDEGYADVSASRKTLKEFCKWYDKLLDDAARTIRVGGFVAVINMGQYFRLPADFTDGYIDWPLRAYQELEAAGLTPWARVGVTYPVSLHTGYDVNAAKKGKFMLPVLGDIIIMRRTT
jgi:hypothetical protein